MLCDFRVVALIGHSRNHLRIPVRLHHFFNAARLEICYVIDMVCHDLLCSLDNFAKFSQYNHIKQVCLNYADVTLTARRVANLPYVFMFGSLSHHSFVS